MENINDKDLMRICREAPKGQTHYVNEMRDWSGNTYSISENGNCIINKSRSEIDIRNFCGSPRTYLLTDMMDELKRRVLAKVDSL